MILKREGQRIPNDGRSLTGRRGGTAEALENSVFSRVVLTGSERRLDLREVGGHRGHLERSEALGVVAFGELIVETSLESDVLLVRHQRNVTLVLDWRLVRVIGGPPIASPQAAVGVECAKIPGRSVTATRQ